MAKEKKRKGAGKPAPISHEPDYVDALYRMVQEYVRATPAADRVDNTLLIIPGGDDAKILANVVMGKVRGVIAVSNDLLAELGSNLIQLAVRDTAKAADFTVFKAKKDWDAFLERMNSWKNSTDKDIGIAADGIGKDGDDTPPPPSAA